MRMGDVLKGGWAAVILAVLGSGCVRQSKYDRMVKLYYDRDREVRRLATENEDLKIQLAGKSGYPDLIAKLFAEAPLEAEGLGVRVPDLCFGAGKHELTGRAKAALNSIARQVRERNLWAMVDGHTDADPIRRSKYTSNLHLSAMRAKEVAEYLCSQGVPKSRVFVRGFGDNAPRASNTTRTGKAENRRVEIYGLKRPPAMLRGSFSGEEASFPAPATQK